MKESRFGVLGFFKFPTLKVEAKGKFVPLAGPPDFQRCKVGTPAGNASPLKTSISSS
jgi:hypothetical protein